MNIDDSDAENVVVQKDGDGGGNTGVQSARSGGKRRDRKATRLARPDFAIRMAGKGPVNNLLGLIRVDEPAEA